MVIGPMTTCQPILTNGFPAPPAIKALGGLFGILGQPAWMTHGFRRANPAEVTYLLSKTLRAHTCASEPLRKCAWYELERSCGF